MLNALLDVAAAALILVTLGLTCVAAVAVTGIYAAPALDLPALFAALRGPEIGEYRGLLVCLLSTLLPTALHLGVGMFGLFTLASRRLGRPLADMPRDGGADAMEGRDAGAILAVSAAASAFLPVFLLYQALVLAGRPLLDGFVALLEAWARVLGAL